MNKNVLRRTTKARGCKFLGVDAEAQEEIAWVKIVQEAPYSTIYIYLLLVYESKGENTLASLLAPHKPLNLVMVDTPRVEAWMPNGTAKQNTQIPREKIGCSWRTEFMRINFNHCNILSQVAWLNRQSIVLIYG